MTNEQKLDALKELLDGATYEDVAKKYSVSKQYIFQIFSPIIGKRGEGARIKGVKYETLHDFIVKNYGSVNKFCKKNKDCKQLYVSFVKRKKQHFKNVH